MTKIIQFRKILFHLLFEDYGADPHDLYQARSIHTKCNFFYKSTIFTRRAREESWNLLPGGALTALPWDKPINIAATIGESSSSHSYRILHFLVASHFSGKALSASKSIERFSDWGTCTGVMLSRFKGAAVEDCRNFTHLLLESPVVEV